MSELSFTIQHCLGKENELPDTLSRNPNPDEESPGEPDLDKMCLPTFNAPVRPKTDEIPTLSAMYRPSIFEEVAIAQQEDKVISRDVLLWKSIVTNGATSTEEERFLSGNKLNEDGFWRRDNLDQWRMCVPHSMRQRVLWELHDAPLSGHPGSDETIRDIRRYFCWPGMNREIRRYVAGCHICICCKPVRGQFKPGLRPRSTRTAWETIAVDLMGPYPRTTNGNRFILVVTDLFTSWVEAFPLRCSEAPCITKILQEEVFSHFGYPKRL